MSRRRFVAGGVGAAAFALLALNIRERVPRHEGRTKRAAFAKTPALPDDVLLIVVHDAAPTYSQDSYQAVSQETGQAGTGFETDLLRMFAGEIGRKPQFVVVKNAEEALARLDQGDVHMAAAWLSPEPNTLYSPPFYETGSAIVQHEASLPLDDLARAGERVVQVVAGSRQALQLREIAKTTPVKFEERENISELALLEAVARQQVELVLADTSMAAMAGDYWPVLQNTLRIGEDRPIVWRFMPDVDAHLVRQAAGFIAHAKKNGAIERVRDRYFGHVQRMTSDDMARFIERTRKILPRFRTHFQRAQADTGFDWRLLAALAYQESAWDPLATSPTGVRGMMMLTEETADRLRVSNRLDPVESIKAGARYLSVLRDSLPDSVGEPDRTWIALAAYNIGPGHMNGARSIATSLKADPDSWYELKQVLPLLSRPEYYSRLKSGRARGGEAVILVENIRTYFDVLSRHEMAFSAIPNANI